jgi:hypothetical protein
MTWLTSLKTKFKSERRKLTHDEAVVAARAKFAVKRRTPAESEVQPPLKKVKRTLLKVGVNNDVVFFIT